MHDEKKHHAREQTLEERGQSEPSGQARRRRVIHMSTERIRNSMAKDESIPKVCARSGGIRASRTRGS